MLDGVALHALVTGDGASRAAVGRMADRLASSGYVNDIGSLDTETEGRTQARMINTFVLAWYLKVPSAAGHDWAARARDALSKTLSTQSGDGAYRFGNQCGHNKPWMTGMVNDAMIRYYDLIERDGRIVSSVKRSVDYMWGNDWRSGGQAFVYIAGNCNGETPYESADLNNLITNGFGFVYRETRDGTYRERGDAVFNGAIYRGWIGASKQFNQQYTTAYRYLRLRQ
jgi:hypothetical protein